MLDTVQATEVLWTLAALAGLWTWGANLRTAVLTLRASRQIKASAIGSLWVRFSSVIIALLVGVELIFIAIGVLFMAVPPSPTASTVRTWFYASLFIAASLGITAAAFVWRRVDQEFLRLARADNGVPRPATGQQ